MTTPRRILVTGVGGFVGSHLARRIAEAGDVALGLGIEAAPPATARWLAQEWRADILDAESLGAALHEARPSVIVHLAGQSSASWSFQHPLETFHANALGTATLLEAVRSAAAEARVLIVGSGEVYGTIAVGTRAGEHAPFQPASPYALSKAVADTIAEYHGKHGLDVVRTRSFGHIGPGQTDRFFVPSLARQIAEIEGGRGEGVVRVGNLEVIRDITDVRDVVEAYLALVEKGRSGSAYNVCRGEGVRLADLVQRMCERAKAPVQVQVDAARLRSSDVSYLVGDPSSIERDTGWKATIPLERALDEILETWRGRSRPEAP